MKQSGLFCATRYMGWCGCHEILIPCSTTIMFSTTFLVICISRVEDEDESEFIWVVENPRYERHSFRMELDPFIIRRVEILVVKIDPTRRMEYQRIFFKEDKPKCARDFLTSESIT